MAATYSPTKFFTNYEENTLLSKIEGIFTHRNIHFFDALVGYFYASGYFRIRPYIERAAEVRVLVGINVDKLAYQAAQQGVLFIADGYRSQEEFFEIAKKNIQQAKYSKIVEDGMIGMITDITNTEERTKAVAEWHSNPFRDYVAKYESWLLLNGYLEWMKQNSCCLNKK